MAGECPPDQTGIDVTGAGAMENSGASDTVLAMIQLGDHYHDIKGRVQRLRYIEVEPGGEIAWHSHGDRLGIIYMLEGTMIEHRSTCAVPIEHVAGDAIPEYGRRAH